MSASTLRFKARPWTSPITVGNVLLYGLLATALLTIFHVLVRSGLVLWYAPGGRGVAFFRGLPRWTLSALDLWVQLSAVVSLLLPLTVLGIWRRSPSVRRTYVPYILLMVIHSISEFAFAIFFGGINMLVGFTYTTYRVYQLWSAQRYMAQAAEPVGRGRLIVRGVLLLGLIFWSANFLFVGTIVVTQFAWAYGLIVR